jgi:hypothetical protein
MKLSDGSFIFVAVVIGLWLGGPACGLGWAVDSDELIENVYER